VTLTKEAKDIIRTLEENNFYVECPCCGEQILLKDAGLFYLDDFSPEAEKLYQQKSSRNVRSVKKRFGKNERRYPEGPRQPPQRLTLVSFWKELRLP
jgi:hypothetical protein